MKYRVHHHRNYDGNNHFNEILCFNPIWGYRTPTHPLDIVIYKNDQIMNLEFFSAMITVLTTIFALFYAFTIFRDVVPPITPKASLLTKRLKDWGKNNGYMVFDRCNYGGNNHFNLFLCFNLFLGCCTPQNTPKTSSFTKII